MNKLKSKKDESMITQIDDNECGVYEIFMKSRYYKGTGKKIVGGEVKDSAVLWANSKGQEIIYKLFSIVKSELRPMVHIRNTPKDTFERTSNVLFQDFLTNERKIKDSELERIIKEKITQLKDNEFIIGLDEDFNLIQVDLEEIMNMFLILRKQQIQFYEDILAEYQQRRQDYVERRPEIH